MKDRITWLIFSCMGCWPAKVSGTILLSLFFVCSPINSAELSLEQAIELALDYNYSVRSAVYDSVAANENYHRAAAGRLPSLSLESRAYYVSDLTGMEIDLGFIDPIVRELGSQENYQADFRVTLPLFTGGKLSGGINAALAQSRAAGYGLEAQRLAVAYRTRQAYLLLMLANTNVAIAQTSLKRLQIIKDDVTNLYVNGIADSVDVLEASLSLETGKLALIEQETLKKNAEKSLQNLTGLKDNLHIKSELPGNKNYTLAENRTSAKILRPELSRLQYVTEAAEQNARLAVGNYFPTLSAFGGYSVGKPNRDMFGADWDDYFSVGLSLSWAFDLGRDNAVASARNHARSAIMLHHDLEEQLLLQAEQAGNKLKLTADAIEISRRELDIAKRRFELATEKQKAGNLSVNRLLEMEAALTATDEQYHSSLIRYFLAETDLLYALGSDNIFGGIQ